MNFGLARESTVLLASARSGFFDAKRSLQLPKRSACGFGRAGSRQQLSLFSFRFRSRARESVPEKRSAKQSLPTRLHLLAEGCGKISQDLCNHATAFRTRLRPFKSRQRNAPVRRPLLRPAKAVSFAVLSSIRACSMKRAPEQVPSSPASFRKVARSMAWVSLFGESWQGELVNGAAEATREEVRLCTMGKKSTIVVV